MVCRRRRFPSASLPPPLSFLPLLCPAAIISICLLSTISIHCAPPPPPPLHPQSVGNSDCVDLICAAEGGRLRLLERQGHQEELLDSGTNAGKVLDRCRTCTDCTYSGYSVCVHHLQFDEHTRQFNPDEEDGEEGACECAHSGPSVLVNNAGAAANQKSKNVVHHPEDKQQQPQCRVLPGTGATRPGQSPQHKAEPALAPGESMFRVCYASALRKLPIPKATNEPGGHPVLLTVDQFWLADYWQAFKPSNLRLVYMFPVGNQQQCEGDTVVPSAQEMMWISEGKTRAEVSRLGMQWLCKGSLHIAMNGVDNDEEEGEAGRGGGGGEKIGMGKQHDDAAVAASDGDGAERGLEKEEDYYDDDDDDDDPDMPPEVQFERDVFAGSDRVRFYYQLQVHRANQLKPGPGSRLRFEDRTTLVNSDTLDFDLHPEIYGSGGRSHSLSGAPGNNNNGTAARVDRVNIEPYYQGKKGGKDAEMPREPIVRPASRSPGKLAAAAGKNIKGSTANGGGTTTTTTTMGHSTSTALTSRSSSTASSTPSTTFTNDHRQHHHQQQYPVDQSTEVPMPPAAHQSVRANNENNNNDYADDDDQAQHTTGAHHHSSPSVAGGTALNSAAAADDEVPEEDWLLLRNIVLGAMLLLILFLLVAICYKRRICCFAGRGHHNSSVTTRNGASSNGRSGGGGKTRTQNGKEYRETSTTGGGYPR